MKDTICVAVGLVGGFFTAIFGGWDSALVTLVVFMAIDFFTGIITAMMKKSKHTESGGLSAGHSGIGCRPFQQERLFLWKCNFLYHSCRDNLPLSDDILPYDRAGVKEYTAQR